MPLALPTPFISEPVIPFAPNAPDDRGHTWDWPGHAETLPSGVSISSATSQTQGNETITLGYVGLTRAEVRTLEAFVEARVARKTGFWCPTFQHDFYAVHGADFGVSNQFATRDWGFLDHILPLTFVNSASVTVHWPYNIFAVYGANIAFIRMSGSVSNPGVFDATGARIVGYQIDGSPGNQVAFGHVFANGDPPPQMVSRALWVRFADDAMTTEWTHPTFASVTLRVQHLRLETPA